MQGTTRPRLPWPVPVSVALALVLVLAPPPVAARDSESPRAAEVERLCALLHPASTATRDQLRTALASVERLALVEELTQNEASALRVELRRRQLSLGPAPRRVRPPASADLPPRQESFVAASPGPAKPPVRMDDHYQQYDEDGNVVYEPGDAFPRYDEQGNMLDARGKVWKTRAELDELSRRAREQLAEQRPTPAPSGQGRQLSAQEGRAFEEVLELRLAFLQGPARGASVRDAVVSAVLAAIEADLPSPTTSPGGDDRLARLWTEIRQAVDRLKAAQGR